jgi:hypothetical protein
MPVATASITGFGGANSSLTGEPLTRVITLDANPGLQPAHFIESASRVIGGYSEAVAPADASKAFLQRTTSGLFGLAKDLPAAADVASPFDPNN